MAFPVLCHNISIFQPSSIFHVSTWTAKASRRSWTAASDFLWKASTAATADAECWTDAWGEEPIGNCWAMQPMQPNYATWHLNSFCCDSSWLTWQTIDWMTLDRPICNFWIEKHCKACGRFAEALQGCTEKSRPQDVGITFGWNMLESALRFWPTGEP